MANLHHRQDRRADRSRDAQQNANAEQEARRARKKLRPDGGEDAPAHSDKTARQQARDGESASADGQKANERSEGSGAETKQDDMPDKGTATARQRRTTQIARRAANQDQRTVRRGQRATKPRLSQLAAGNEAERKAAANRSPKASKPTSRNHRPARVATRRAIRRANKAATRRAAAKKAADKNRRATAPAVPARTNRPTKAAASRRKKAPAIIRPTPVRMRRPTIAPVSRAARPRAAAASSATAKVQSPVARNRDKETGEGKSPDGSRGRRG